MSDSEAPVSGRPNDGGVGATDPPPIPSSPSADRVIGGRYRLGTRRGIGLDIAIFEATDMHTGRTVAVKIIHPDICAAPGFGDRFSTTIEQVMRTRHPNLVEVLGAGAATWNEQPVHYVVCENLSGGSLRDLRDRGRQVSPSQGVMIGLDVCKGLDVAHRAGLIHGDIRPGNLVFGSDGRLRVADLGLAALVTGEGHGEPSAMSIDRARYAAPEQATRHPITHKTDVYALCLCVVEAVTGVLPFVGESTVATLSNRVDKLMPVSADLGPLAAVIERAGRPDPADRSSASEFGRGLVQAAEKLPRPAPIALLSAGLFAEAAEASAHTGSPGIGVLAASSIAEADAAAAATALASTMISSSATAVAAPTAAIAPTATIALTSVAPGPLVPTVDSIESGNAEATAPADVDRSFGPRDPSQPAPTEPARTEPVTVQPPPPPQPLATPPLLRERHARRKLLVVVTVLVIAAALGGAAAWMIGRDTSHPVPELIGLQQGEALNMVSEFGWTVTVASEASDEIATGIVIRTDPVAGASLDDGADFSVIVSSGPSPRVLPELAGLTVAQARAALDELGLGLQLRDEPFDEDVPVGVILSWTVPDQPSLVAGDTVLPDTNIVVSVSAGPEPRVVPDLTGASLVDATAQLDALTLSPVVAPDEFSEAPAGAVIRQDPPAGASVAPGTTVTIVLSKGPDLVTIPPLAQLTLQQATEALTAAGLAVGSVNGDPAGIVVLARANGTTLTADTLLPRSTPIELTLEAPAPPTTTVPAAPATAAP